MKPITSKILNLLWCVAFFGMLVFISCSAVSVFNNMTYSQIFIEGDSMNPTLEGHDYYANYGKMDVTDYAKDHICRYDIVITYYPTEDDYEGGYHDGGHNVLKPTATYKIKRVYGLPNERFSLEEETIPDPNNEELTFTIPHFYTFQGELKIDHPFDFDIIHASRVRSGSLNDHQYWVMGDNWSASNDSYRRGPIYRDNIVGVLHCIEGHGTIDNSVTPHEIKDLVPEDIIYYKRHG